MCHLISVVSAYIFGAVRNLKSTLPAVLFLLVSSIAVTAQANEVYDFEDEDFTANYRDDDPATSEVDESTLLDGTYTLPVGAFTSFGIAGTGVSSVVQEDGSSSSMLKFEKGVNSEWWSGFTLASEYKDTDFRGDGSSPITMTVLADQPGSITLELETSTGKKYSVHQPVTGGWNSLSFDFSDDAAIKAALVIYDGDGIATNTDENGQVIGWPFNWSKINIRPDAEGETNNGDVVRFYYFDDITFPGANIVMPPEVVLTLDMEWDGVGFVRLNSSLWDWVEGDIPIEAYPFPEDLDGDWTPDNLEDDYVVTLQLADYIYNNSEVENAVFEYRWSSNSINEDLTSQPAGSCNDVYIKDGYTSRIFDNAAVRNSTIAKQAAEDARVASGGDVDPDFDPSHIDTFGVCHPQDNDNDGLPDVMDSDDDNDLVSDENDAFPLDKNFFSNDWTAPAFSETFDGTEIDGSLVDGTGPLYTFPSDSGVQPWAGFANKHLAVYPLYFTEDGSITFDASVPNGTSVDVRFKFERLPYNTNGDGAASTLPDHSTAAVTVSGAETNSYTVAVPSQGANVFESLLMYLDTRDVGVIVKNVVVNSDSNSGGNGEPIPGTITFSVDMTGHDTTNGVPNVAGSWDDFALQVNDMSDDDGDGIWTLDIPLDPAGYSYKFAIASTMESLTDANGDSLHCAAVTYALDGVTEFQNRYITVDGDAVLLTVPYAGCNNVDSDGDGVFDHEDAFPNDASETTDTDGDGVGDNEDYAPNDPDVTEDTSVAPTVPATPTGGLVLDFENMVDAGAYPVYGGVGASIGQKTEVDGVTVRNMLVLDNGAGAQWWSGVTIVAEYVDSDLIGDGSAPVTMRVYADQDGNLNFELEADGQTSVIINKAVVAGWNSLSFDVSDHAAINWHKAQIRPDALGEAANVAATRYYIDDVHFANATIVQEPVPAVIIALPVDFEEAADAYEIAGFDGGVATVEAGPDGANSLKYVKGAGQNWAGAWINLNTAVDSANGEVVTADVHSTVARDITLKFDAAGVERVASHTGSGWEALSYDFTGAMPADQTKIAFFNDLSQQGDGTDAWTIYIDNLAQASAPAPVDSDGDGVADDADAFPNDASETTDTDSDGTGDNADAFPNDASETTDTDGDGVGDNSDYAPNDPNVTVAPTVPATPTGGLVLDFENMVDAGAYPVYGGVGASIGQKTEVDGVTVRNMLVLDNGAGAQWWSGVTIVAEYVDSDLIGDGSAPVTMRVYADQDGNLNFELEADGQTSVIINKAVVAGWNSLSFDVSDHAAINWHKAQIRPDALGEAANVAATRYYIDDVHFANATIVQEPVPAVIIALPVDFEEAADAYEIAGFDGGVATVEAGPDGANSLKYVKGAGQNWAGAWINLNTAVDSANGEVVTADVHSTVARDITLKFDAAGVERVASHTGSGWEALSYDFTGAMPADQTKIAFFNDLSQQGDGTDAWTIYIDNLAQASAPAPVDSDGDGVADDADAFPNDASETTDTDSDGTGDNADAFPNDASETTDTDGDGVGDNSDYAPNDPNVTVAPTVPATPTGGLVLDFENMVDAGAYPVYGGVGASIGQKTEVDGVTVRNMLVLDNGAGAQWWSGVTIVAEYVDSDLIGDGSAPVTMRVYADQDGNLNFELEADGQTSVIINKAVVAGWNSLSFDVSDHAAINWHKAQIRPDALGEAANVAATRYYIDDVHFANATIVQEPVPAVIIALPVDFEEAADAYEIAGFDGGVATVEAGPDGANSLKYVKGAGQNWAGAWINLNTAVDSANGEVVTADVHSTVARDITLKFDAAGVERVASHTGSGWEALSYDFTGAMPADQTKIAFFNDLSQQGDGTDAWTIYIDNLAQASAPAPVDSDGDGVADDADAFPNDASETTDTDSDGTGDNADAFPNDASETTDTDGDGVGDNSDYAPNDPNVTVAPTVPATPTGGLVLDFENMVDAGAYPVYGGVGASIGQKTEVDGVTVRNMLVLDNGAGAQWWSGVTIVAEYVDSDLIGDGSAPVTMRVYADQDGNLNFELEADGQTSVIINKAVVAGWNSLSFDVSDHAAINWHKAQIRPDALGEAANVAATRYYIDDVHFANATIVQEPVPAVIIALPVDFEEAADAYEIAGFDGGVATVEAGPDGANSLKYVKGAGQNWAGAWINLNTAVDSANGEVVTADVHSTVARDITLKFDAAGVERVASHTGSGWEALSYDFTGAMPADQTKIAFFNDLSQQGDGTDAWTIYIDNLAQASAPAPVDSDGDGVADDADAFPNDASETTDTDSDGTGDNADAFPNDASETTDTDGDGVGDNSDYAPNDPNVTVAPTVPATPTGGLVLDFENMVDAGAYPVYGGVGASIGQKTEVDGVTVRNMLVLDNGAGAQWWSGVTIVAEYVDSDLIGDGSAPVTMRVYADQDGNLNFELEADGQTSVIINKAVVAGWNSLSFDVSDHAAINWHKAQIRPDALGEAANVAATRYYIDDVHFANATIVQEPVPAVIIALPVDFEEAADAYEIAGFDGGVATVEAGPDGANSLKYVKGAGQNWAGAWINLNTAVDSANGEVVTADVHSTVARDITLKFDAAGVERVASHTGSGWEALSYDFTGAMPADQTKIAFFNDLSQQGDGTDAWTIYIDNLAQASAPAPVDSDGDGVADDADAFPNDASETTDTDSDGTGDNADAFPNDASETADTDSDGTGDNADAFPNDASETADTDSDGVGDNSDYAPNDPNVTVAPALPEQQVSVVNTPMGLVGSDVEVIVSYDASNGDDTVTGLGIRLHYDSSVLTFVSQSDVLAADNIGASGPYNDDDNDDSDTSTDKYVDGAWASFGGAWPGALPAELFTVTFTVNDVDSASTDINFSSTSTAVGYEFAPTSYSMDIIEGSFDFDGNGTFDALTDGLLFLRYAFEYRGDDATNGVIATDSPKSDAEVLASLETAMSSFGDIDGNGVVDALTDGLLLIRSLFGFTGDALISDAVGDSTTAGAVGDATRTTAAEIQTYIDSMSL